LLASISSISLAADFSPFFYGRLAEGATVVQAMRAFMDRFAGASPGLAPVVCLPSVEAAERPIWAPAEKADSDLPRTETARAGRAARPVSISDQAAAELKVRIEFEPVSAINPALLMNGRAPIERLAIDASRGGDNLRLEIVCDAGSGRSAFRQTLSLSNGMQPIVHENIHFPILYELATQRAPRRYVNFLISVLAEKGATGPRHPGPGPSTAWRANG